MRPPTRNREMQDSANDHNAAYGDVLVIRGGRPFHVFFGILLAFAGALLTLLGAGHLIDLALNAYSGRGPPWWFALLPLSMGVGMLAKARATWREFRMRIWFHEHAAVQVRGRSRVEICYSDAIGFRMSVTHARLGFHFRVATEVSLRLRGADDEEIYFNSPYKVKARGLLRPTYEHTDDIDVIKWHIAEKMSESALRHIEDGDELSWCGQAILSAGGITPIAGDNTAPPIPYASFQRHTLDDQTLCLYTRDEAPAVLISTDGMNFWPGYVLFLRLASLDPDNPSPDLAD